MITKKPKWVEYQTNGKTPQENYQEQKKKFIAEVMEDKEIKTQIENIIADVLNELN